MRKSKSLESLITIEKNFQETDHSLFIFSHKFFFQ